MFLRITYHIYLSYISYFLYFQKPWKSQQLMTVPFTMILLCSLYNIIIYNYSNVSCLLFLGSKETLEHNFTYMYSIKRICSYDHQFWTSSTKAQALIDSEQDHTYIICSKLELWWIDTQRSWHYVNILMGDCSWIWLPSCPHQVECIVHGNYWSVELDTRPNDHSPALSRPLCISPWHLWMPDSLELLQTW